jgi:hypothetical protein
MMQPGGILEQTGVMPRNWVARPAVPLLARFAAKFVLDIMPAALASVIGGFLFTQYQFGHTAPPQPALQQVTPASAEMMALVRDEHAMIIDYLKVQMAAEKSRAATAAAAAEDADVQTAPNAQAVDRVSEPRIALEASARRIAATVAAAKPSPQRAKAAPAAAASLPHAPLVIAQAQQDPPPDGAREPNSLLARTLDIKDHVFAATRHVVFMIGDAFASVGERIGGAATAGRQFSSDS